MANITIKLYDVVEGASPVGFLSACRGISKMSLEDRDTNVGDYPMKMEVFRPCREGRGLFLMDFSQRRWAGLGYASPTITTRPLKLQKGEGVSVLTAALYDDTTKKMLIQYNRSGARDYDIVNYVNAHSGANFEFWYTVKKKVEALIYADEGYANSISFSFLRGEISPEYQKRGVLMDDVYKAIDATGMEGVGEITLTLKKEKGARDNKITKFRRVIESLRDSGRVTTMKASVSPSPDQAAEVLDLMDAYEKVTLPGLAKDKNKMYPLEGDAGREHKLLDAYRRWKKQGVIHL